jgi:hypothetical protein
LVDIAEPCGRIEIREERDELPDRARRARLDHPESMRAGLHPRVHHRCAAHALADWQRAPDHAIVRSFMLDAERQIEILCRGVVDVHVRSELLERLGSGKPLMLVGRDLMPRYGKRAQLVMTTPILEGTNAILQMSKDQAR